MLMSDDNEYFDDEDLPDGVIIPDDDDSLNRFNVINDNQTVIAPVSRKMVKPPSKLTRMRCWPEVEERLKAGFSTETIAKWIQQTKCEYTDVTEGTLIVMLANYRKHKMPDIEKVAIHIPDFAAKALSKVEAGVDEINELGILYALQLGRIEMAIEQEQNMGFLSKGLTDTFKLAQQILSARAEIKLQLGVPVQEGNLSQKDEVFRRVGGNMAELVKNKESRAKVLSALAKIKRLKGFDVEDIDEAVTEIADQQGVKLDVKQLTDGRATDCADKKDKK